MRSTLAISVALVLAGCAVGPDYHRPAIDTKAQFIETDAQTFSNADIEQDFWRLFNDPMLTQLIEDSLAANHDVKIAAASLQEARAFRNESRFDFAPTVTAQGGYTQSRASVRQAPAGSGIPRSQDYYDASFDASWELDLFGRVRRNVEAKSAQYQAAIADLQNAEVSVTAEVARNYFELRGYQQQLNVAQRNAENQRQTLDLTQLRLDAGSGTELDTARARAQLSSTLAEVPTLEASVARASYRISVLTGRSPEALVAQLSEPHPIPALPQVQNIGTPEAMLRRRPDIRSAERQLAASTAQIGIAVGDLFPRISLTGSWGYDAVNAHDLGKGPSESYGFGPVIRWAAFDLGRVRQQIKQREAAADGALARYEQSVLRALEETDGSLTNYVKAVSRQQHLRDSAEASARASELAKTRFEDGASDFLTVLDAERSMLEAQNRLAQTDTDTATALLAVYKALGGGFRTQQLTAAAK
jgi:multidrug efflux system outer membrane protein